MHYAPSFEKAANNISQLPFCWKLSHFKGNVLDSVILMQRELSTFPLAPNYLHKLSSAGYITVDDLKDVSPSELSEGKYT